MKNLSQMPFIKKKIGWLENFSVDLQPLSYCGEEYYTLLITFREPPGTTTLCETVYTFDSDRKHGTTPGQFFK